MRGRTKKVKGYVITLKDGTKAEFEDYNDNGNETWKLPDGEVVDTYALRDRGLVA